MAKASGAKAAEDKNQQHAIKMAALGRRFLLGNLYDYSNDSIVPGGGIVGLDASIDVVNETQAKPNLMSSSMYSTLSADDSLDFGFEGNNNFVQAKGVVMNNFNVRVDCLSFEQGPSSKWQHMKLDHHLKASVLAKLVDKMRGAAMYCTDETDTSQAVKVIRVRVNVRKEAIGQDQTLLDQETHSATHFVSEIAHGVEAYVVFSCQVKEDESKADLEEEMEVSLNQLVHALADETEPNFTQDLELRLKGRFYGDLHQHARDCSLPEAYKLLSKLVRDVKLNEEKAVPIVVWLQPICKETCPAVVDLDPDVVDDCIDMLDGIIKIKSRVYTFLKEDEKLKVFPHLRQSLRQFIDFSSRYADLFRSELNRLIPTIRSGLKGIQPIAKLLDVMAEGLFHPKKLGQWLSNKHKEVKALRVIAGMAALKKVSLIQTKDKLDECLFDISSKWALILALPPLDGRSDPFLQEMKHYIDNNRRIVRIQHDPSLQLPMDQEEAPWFTMPNISQELTKTARRMIQLADMTSGQNENGELVAFYMTSLLPSPSPYFPTLSLFKEAQLVDGNFNLPIPPTNLRLKLDLKRASGVVLEWDCQQLKDVTHFTLQFKKIGDLGDWQCTSTLNASNTFVELKNVKEPFGLQFRVASVSLIGRSDFSTVFEVHTPSAKNCPPPTNLKCGLVSHNSIELLWDPPQLQDPNDPRLIGYDIHCAEHQPNSLRVSATVSSCRLEALTKGTEYTIDVSADYGHDGRSSAQTIRVTTSAQTNRQCDLLRRTSPLMGTYSGLQIYSIPLTSVPTPDVTKIRRFVFGQPSSAAVRGSAQHKTVLVMGATGSGKTTLINGMINFILGVEWDDDFRFKIIVESGSMSQAFSQTSAVTAYEIHYTDGFKIPYSLTIVDTPGYGDTKGLSHDQFITANIRQFFEDQCGIQEVDAVGFVSQASLPRLTPTQIYIFDSVLSIFGKDIQENVQFLLTFADSQEPPVLAAIQEAKIPCPLDDDGFPQHHKFNNSGFFAANKGPDAIATRFNNMFWKMGMENFKNFFCRLSSLTTKSLSLTRQVLDERKRLEVTVEGLQPKIHQGLTKMEELRKTRMFVANNEAQIDANVDVEFEVEVNVAKKINISHTGHYLTNCQVCHVTCHYPCGIARDEDKKRCWAMDGSAGYCRICPNKCFWSSHANQTYRYEYVLEKQKSSSDQLRRKYERLLEKKLSAQDLIDALEQDLKTIQGDVLQLVKTAAHCIHRLEEIALRPNPCSTPEYIDMMVNAELQEKREGYKERVKSLQHVRQLAELTQKIRNKETLMPGADLPQSASGNDPPIIKEEDQVKLEKFQNLFI